MTTLLLLVILFSYLPITLWKLFSMAGKPGWAALIPFYDLMTYVDIAKKPRYHLYYLIPIRIFWSFAPIFMLITLSYTLAADAFRYTLGVLLYFSFLLFPFIFAMPPIIFYLMIFIGFILGVLLFFTSVFLSQHTIQSFLNAYDKSERASFWLMVFFPYFYFPYLAFSNRTHYIGLNSDLLEDTPNRSSDGLRNDSSDGSRNDSSEGSRNDSPDNNSTPPLE